MRSLRNRHLLSADLLTLPLAVYVSFLLRLDTLALGVHTAGFFFLTALAIVLIPLLLLLSKAYQHSWRYASVEELISLTGTVSCGVAVIGAIAFVAGLLNPDLGIPRSIPLILLPIALGAVSAPRLALRFAALRSRRVQPVGDATPVLIMGAGDAGALVVRELQHNQQLNLRLVGLLDDDPRKLGVMIHGAPILGDRTAIRALVEREGVRQVIIAMPRASGKAISEILHLCEEVGVQASTLPGIFELIDGKLSVSQLRKVEIADLLRREPVETDTAAVCGLLRGRRVLITGGGGSIGSELCRQVLRSEPAELIVLGHGENSVFEILQELKRILADRPTTTIRGVIADIRDAARIQAVFERYRPEIVFHAAAHKHVPLMEENPAEAVSNNVLGTRNLLDAADATGVEHFVMISSDKAVNPTSVMGATKRIAEMLVHKAASKTGRHYVAVRFGNVLGSRGSVVLSFKRQIAEGGPVTVTHPEMQRYFMTIPEAVQLVLQAAVLGRQGEVFMLEMGKPVKIVDLARDMIRLSGLEVGRDIDIVYSGLRPGEKLFEELFATGESYKPTEHDKIFIAGNASSCVPQGLVSAIQMLERCVEQHDEQDLLSIVHWLVPEYAPTGPNAERVRAGAVAGVPPWHSLLQPGQLHAGAAD